MFAWNFDISFLFSCGDSRLMVIDDNNISFLLIQIKFGKYFLKCYIGTKNPILETLNSSTFSLKIIFLFLFSTHIQDYL